MNILKALHQTNEAIENWIYAHPVQTILYTLLSVAVFITVWHFVPVLAIMLLAIYGLGTLAIMIGSVTYLTKIGYTPPRCDKCGHVLPEERPSNGTH